MEDNHYKGYEMFIWKSADGYFKAEIRKGGAMICAIGVTPFDRYASSDGVLGAAKRQIDFEEARELARSIK